MAKRESRRQRSDWIVRVIVIVVIAFLALISAQQKYGLNLNLPELPKLESLGVELLNNLLADAPASAALPQELVPADADDAENAVRVHFIDVGQGKSILIEAPDKNILIDAGENNQGAVVLRYLASRGIDRLGIAIGTHPHSDHIGGLDDVILALPVEMVILPVIPMELTPTNPTYTDLLNAIAEKGLKITPAKQGAEYDLGGGAILTVLGPVRNDYKDLNDFSVVSRLDYGGTSFLFTGDATATAEKDLLDLGTYLRAAVLDVGHHGSSTSSSKDFIKAVNPRIAVISCGIDNMHNHPHRSVAQRLEAIPDIAMIRTDLDGSIKILSNGKKLSYQKENQ